MVFMGDETGVPDISPTLVALEDDSTVHNCLLSLSNDPLFSTRMNKKKTLWRKRKRVRKEEGRNDFQG